MPEPTEIVADMITEWQATRLAMAELERAEHPDITDPHGRVWTWHSGAGADEMYKHDGMAWPVEWIARGGLPRPEGLANPNYSWCEICRQGS